MVVVYMKIGKSVFILLFCSLYQIIVTTQAAGSEPLQEAITKTAANVVFMRHALAPGYGDPAAFQIDKCSTQRNLNKAGRQQARATGRYLRKHKFVFDEILSSQWCRCKHTAELLNIGSWTEFKGLNSFFQGHANREATLDRLQQKLGRLPTDTLVLMITHQVVISAITAIAPASGDFVVYNTKTNKAESVQLR